MDKISGKIKDICRSMITTSHYNQLDGKTFDNYIKEIHQAYLDEGWVKLKSPQGTKYIIGRR